MLSIMILGGSITAAMALAELPVKIIIFGFILGALILAYQLAIFFLGRKNRILLAKEIVIAFIYTAGIWGGPLLLYTQKLQGIQAIVLFVFLLMTFSNTTLLSYFEYENDRHSVQVSFSIQFGKHHTSRLLKLLLFSTSIFTLGLLIFWQTIAMYKLSISILMLMSIVMLAMINSPHFFQRQNRYKIIIESVFLLPALIFLH